MRPHVKGQNMMGRRKAMQCPVDGETLVMADRGGVEIDYCPKCRGVWLDRGELDKIIERSVGGPSVADTTAQVRGARGATPGPVYQAEPRQAEHRPDRREGERYRDDDDDHRYYGKKKRRESFLGELFDF
jgi:uncharacterized protein